MKPINPRLDLFFKEEKKYDENENSAVEKFFGRSFIFPAIGHHHHHQHQVVAVAVEHH